jgi:hypothetical protein
LVQARRRTSPRSHRTPRRGHAITDPARVIGGGADLAFVEDGGAGAQAVAAAVAVDLVASVVGGAGDGPSHFFWYRRPGRRLRRGSVGTCGGSSPTLPSVSCCCPRSSAPETASVGRRRQALGAATRELRHSPFANREQNSWLAGVPGRAEDAVAATRTSSRSLCSRTP